MKTATSILTAIAAIGFNMSAMAAEQGATGMVTSINRINSTISIKRVESGTVGANTGDTAEQFKVKDAAMIDSVHAGDRVTFSSSDSGNTKTITKLERQK